MTKPIFLIGGTAGTGKTTLARDLSYHLIIDHRLGTGFIREIVRAESSQENDPYLFRFTFQGDNVVENLRLQADRLYPAIMRCINRARTEGTSLIIEGNHLIPELYSEVLVDGFYILKPSLNHREMLEGATHSNRLITDSDFEKVKTIDDYLRAECQSRSVPCVSIDDCRKLVYNHTGVTNESQH